MKWYHGVFSFCLFFLYASGFSVPKVYDCFLFHDELEVIKCRMAELDAYVDYFILVEGCETFQGCQKAFSFEDHLDDFTQYLHKIIHEPIREKQCPSPQHGWEREFYQRQLLQDMCMRYCDENDIIMISDADEIPRGSLLPALFAEIENGEELFLLCHFWTSYYMNRVHTKSYGFNLPKSCWPGTVITTKKYLLLQRPLYSLRQNRVYCVPRSNWVLNAGWHFSTCGGGIGRMQSKTEAGSH